MVTSNGSEDTRKYDCDCRKYEIDFDKKKLYMKEVCARMVARNLSSKQKTRKCTSKL
jgi:ribosomal protein L40E